MVDHSDESDSGVENGDHRDGTAVPLPCRTEPIVAFTFSAVSMHRTKHDAERVESRVAAAMKQLETELRERTRQRSIATLSETNHDPVQLDDHQQIHDDIAEAVTVSHVTDLRRSNTCDVPERSSVLFLVPQPTLHDVSGEPLLPSRLVQRITSLRAWPIILAVVAAIGVGLSTVALGLADTTLRSAAYMLGFGCLLVPLLLHTFMYSRGMCRHTIAGFEFWYLSVQIIIFSSCETVQALSAGLPLWVGITPRIVLTGVACVGLLCIDGSSLSRVIKGCVMLIAGFLFAGLGLSWRFNSAVADNQVTVLGITTTVGSLATSSYATLGVFCFKFALNILVLGRPVVLIGFTWVEDDITHLRPRVVPAPLPATSEVPPS